MTVLDASAVLAFVNDERGADMVGRYLEGGILGAANLAEVIGKLVDVGVEPGSFRGLLHAAGVVIEPVTESDAELAGALRSVEGGRLLSLGDRCCLALALRTESRDVLTAVRAWTELDLPVHVRVVR